LRPALYTHKILSQRQTTDSNKKEMHLPKEVGQDKELNFQTNIFPKVIMHPGKEIGNEIYYK
jgi:hypothetical protein